ncbi:hypothetical protein MRBBS_3834 [Marinobacter sp. BSs20148]|nr:hypothetical protein MRBBS_3834 [Marinobacter sp. BSs20148]
MIYKNITIYTNYRRFLKGKFDDFKDPQLRHTLEYFLH